MLVAMRVTNTAPLCRFVDRVSATAHGSCGESEGLGIAMQMTAFCTHVAHAQPI